MARIKLPNGTYIPVGIRILKAKGETKATQREEVASESPGAVVNLYFDASGLDAVDALTETISGGYLRLRDVIQGYDIRDPKDRALLQAYREQSAGQYPELQALNDTGFPLLVYKLEDLDGKGLKLRLTAAQILEKIEASPFGAMLGSLQGEERIAKAMEIAAAMKDFAS